jgi:histidinol phosphatase-like enzyme (inositol monophosphatase family)
MSPRLRFAVEAAYRAGRQTLAHFNVGVGVELKEDATPVTVADRQAERLIREAIEAAFPRDAILGEEEGGDESIADRWVIDPIDGTKSFICGVPLYGTLLSYEVDRVPQLGVCYLPGTDELIYAERGGGAFLNGRPVRVSTKENLRQSVVCSGGHEGMTRHGRMEGLIALSRETLATRTWSDAFGYTLVASGRVECMMDPGVSRWDVSAFHVIIPEAGGKITDFDGNDVFANGRNREIPTVASNGVLHDRILAAFHP